MNDVLFTREGLVRYSRLPSICELQSELVSLLNLPTHTSRHFMQLMQLNFLHNLENHCKKSSCD